MSEWPTASLGDVVDVRIGPFGSLLHKEDYTEDGVPLVNPMHIDGGSIVADRRHSVKEEKAAELAGYRMMPGDVVLGRRGGMGRCAVVQPAESGFLCGTGSLFLRPDDCVSPEFLAKLMSSPDMVRRLERESLGTTMPNLNRTIVSNIQIALPPIEEQRRIAAILDHADALRAKRREALARLDELAQSIFVDMFGDAQTIHTRWPKVALKDALLDIESGRSPTCHARPATDDEYGVLKLGAVTYGVFNPNQNKALPANVKPDVRHEVKTGDLLFTRKNTADLVGAAALVRETQAKLLLPDLIFRLRIDPRSAMNSTYLQAVLMYPPIRRTIQGLAGGSAGSMPNISKAKLLTVEVPRPATEQQLSYERRIDEIERLKSGHRTAVAELDALFASLQSRAFRGEL